jgi:hypothetical protein
MFKQNASINDEVITLLATRKDLPTHVASPPVEYEPPFSLPPRRYSTQPADAMSLLLSYCEDLITFQGTASHIFGSRPSGTMEERRHNYAAQLADGILVSLVEQTGLSVMETSTLARIVLGLPSGARLGVMGSSSERIAKFVTRLHSHGNLKNMPEIVSLCRSEFCLKSTVSLLDLIIGDIADGDFLPCDGPRLLQLVREGGWATFLSVDRCPVTRELVEIWLSPNPNWTDKGLLRGIFCARRTAGVSGYV